MSHHKTIIGGNYINFNGGFSGEIEFGSPPTLADIQSVVLMWLSREAECHLEDENFSAAAADADLAARLLDRSGT